MAQYWYKQDKRVKRISEDDNSRVEELKANGYVQVLNRRNPKGSIVEKPKPKAKAKPKAKKETE